MSKKILIAKPGILTDQNKTDLNTDGYIVIESKSVSSVKVFNDFKDFEGKMYLKLALSALEHGNDSTCRVAFGRLLREEILKNIKQ